MSTKGTEHNQSKQFQPSRNRLGWDPESLRLQNILCLSVKNVTKPLPRGSSEMLGAAKDKKEMKEMLD